MTAADSFPRAKVRVLVVVGTLMQGGAETYVANVARAIRKYGVGIEICALDRTGPLLDPLVDEGIHVYETPYAGTAYRSNTRRLLATVDAIRRIVKASRYDIVHTYLYWSDVLGVAGARLAGCRRIIISRQAMHGWIHPPGARFHNLEQTANLFANELIACSETALKDAVEKERILPAIRTVIYNGVDVNEYQAAQPRPANGALRLVTVGALAHRKGREYAIEALAQATRSGVRATLQLVGQGPDEAMPRRKVAEGRPRNFGHLRRSAGRPPAISWQCRRFSSPLASGGFFSRAPRGDGKLPSRDRHGRRR
jgi:glycosyltransferase involved in cell wall biosynthesis